MAIAAIATIAMMAAPAFHAVAGDQCSDPAAASATSTASKKGKVLGRFDPAMAGCQFGCAIQAKYDTRDVIAQPGAKTGKLTQCPVSGVVFKVDGKRPRVRHGKDEYVMCCDQCAAKLRKNPGQFVRA